MTIQSFAIEVQMSVDYLIQQFLDIGITKTKFDFITQSEKEILFRHMNVNKIAVFNKLFLQRKTHSTLNVSSTNGKSKKVKVEVRKKRVYMVPCSIRKSHVSNNTNILLVENDNSKDKYKSDDCNELSELVACDENKISSNENQVMCFISQKEKLDHFTIRQDYVRTNELVKDVNQDLDHQIRDRKGLSNSVCCDVLLNVQDEQHDDNNFSCGLSDDMAVSNNIPEHDKQKLENVRKNLTDRLRSTRTRNLSKLVKQNKHNNSKVCMIYESDKDEKLYVLPSSRVYKNKRKQSILVQSFNKPMQKTVRDVVIGETISVAELSNKMSIKSSSMIKMMMKLGLMVTINQNLDQETAQLVVEEMGHNAILRRENALEELIMHDNNNDYQNISSKLDNAKNDMGYKNRAPIVTIMGHVDHGKTSLLDYIRSTNVASSESGGITQNIGAYCVQLANNDMVTFIDTPGHEAFTDMRARGIQLTDIVVLVVAADDGVMPQTVEAIQYIRDGNLPVIIAINKIDKSVTNVERIKNELNSYGFIPEEWGGHTQFVNVSAVSGEGVNDLLDSILVQSEILELKSMHHGLAKAVVIESSLDRSRGPVVTVLVRSGELKCGDIVLCGTEYGRVRAMRDSLGFDVIKAGPSIPVELLGLSGIPGTGEWLVVVNNEKKAREVALYRKEKKREIKLARKSEKTIIENFNSMDIIKIKELNFIIKSDTQGSMEVICESLKKLSTNKMVMKILSASIGNVTETDAVLALSSHSRILAFNVKVDLSAKNIIELNHINIQYYSVIYSLLDEVKELISSTIAPQVDFKVIGIAKVHNIFQSPRYGTIAGCMVTQGVIKLHKQIKIVRNGIIMYKGVLDSLRHFKNDVSEVKIGVECGIGIKNYSDVCSGDIIEVLDKI
ncbi:protein chain initiation factor 2 [Candidatus Blochmanniella floridana]|uniref:Translation initiation factor IF-2 n=1 Tax=Blochmanniella floridana TaxID=203907 RepID=IF2_BLOFL|nr:RecName: Full=Translation initiation factor IF-2 [Candidatus Blochmannia floridanus]CAD83625.1 protein chain initiation factor 2 [Candidatus Blochmannia floridanus]